MTKVTVKEFWSRGKRQPALKLPHLPWSQKGCLIWSTGYLGQYGYGRITWKGRVIGAHRMAWMIANRQRVPKGLSVCHHCDAPACIEPTHLFLGTQTDNIMDMVQKGRNASNVGEKNPRARLTAEKAAEIRRRYANGKEGVKILASRFKTTGATIKHIINNETWVVPEDQRPVMNLDRIQKRIRREKTLVGPKNGFYGRQHSDRTKRHIGKKNKGRLAGERNHNVKLTEEQVRKILERWPKETQVNLAREYGVSQILISLIVRRMAWKHIQL